MGSAERKSTGARRLGIKVMTGMLAAGLAAGIGVPDAARAQEDGAGRIAGNAPAEAGIRNFQAMRVLPLGDSITRGAGSPTRSSYRMALAERLSRGGLQINYVGSQVDGTGTDAQHEGHGGWDIDEMAAEVDGWLAQARPDTVLLHAGTNNITKGDGPYATTDKLSGLIDQIRAARPEAYIFVAQIITSRVPRELADDRAYNRLIPAMVAAKQDPLITVVNQSTIGGIDLHDLRHPNDFGYSKMAWNWYQAMAKVFRTSGDTGPNPYTMQSTHRCLAAKVVVDGEVRHRTECRTWQLRTVNAEINGVHRRIRTWQTLRTVKQAYRVRVGGRVQTRTRLVGKWTGPGNLLNV